MQKVITLVVLALALTSASALYNTSNFTKAPIQVIQDNEVNFTAAGVQPLSLIETAPGALAVINHNFTQNASALGTGLWSIFSKKIDAKSLTGTNGTNYLINQTAVAFDGAQYYSSGYAVVISSVADASATVQLYVYQTPLAGGAALPGLKITSNNATGKGLTLTKVFFTGKTLSVFYNTQANQSVVNVTSITIGGPANATEFTLTSNYSSGLSFAAGEALGTTILAIWLEGTTLKQATFDTVKGLVGTASNINGFNSLTQTCYAYSTDVKLYGALCTEVNDTASLKYTVSNSNLTLANFTLAKGQFIERYSYGPYLSFITKDGNNFYVETWAVDTFVNFKNRTQFLTIDTNTSYSIYKVQSGGLYVFLDNLNTADKTVNNVFVGLLLSGSYLTSVFGLLATIMAALMLF